MGDILGRAGGSPGTLMPRRSLVDGKIKKEMKCALIDKAKCFSFEPLDMYTEQISDV